MEGVSDAPTHGTHTIKTSVENYQGYCHGAIRRHFLLMEMLEAEDPPYSSLREQAADRASKMKRKLDRNARFRAALRATATSKLTLATGWPTLRSSGISSSIVAVDLPAADSVDEQGGIRSFHKNSVCDGASQEAGLPVGRARVSTTQQGTLQRARVDQSDTTSSSRRAQRLDQELSQRHGQDHQQSEQQPTLEGVGGPCVPGTHAQLGGRQRPEELPSVPAHLTPADVRDMVGVDSVPDSALHATERSSADRPRTESPLGANTALAPGPPSRQIGQSSAPTPIASIAAMNGPTTTRDHSPRTGIQGDTPADAARRDPTACLSEPPCLSLPIWRSSRGIVRAAADAATGLGPGMGSYHGDLRCGPSGLTVSEAAWDRLCAAGPPALSALSEVSKQGDEARKEGSMGAKLARAKRAKKVEAVQELRRVMEALPAHRVAERLRAVAAGSSAACAGREGTLAGAATGCGSGGDRGGAAGGTSRSLRCGAEATAGRPSGKGQQGSRGFGTAGSACDCRENSGASDWEVNPVDADVKLPGRALALLTCHMTLLQACRKNHVLGGFMEECGLLDDAAQLHRAALLLTDGLLSYYGLPPVPYEELAALAGVLQELQYMLCGNEGFDLEATLHPAVPGCAASLALFARVVRHCNSMSEPGGGDISAGSGTSYSDRRNGGKNNGSSRSISISSRKGTGGACDGDGNVARRSSAQPVDDSSNAASPLWERGSLEETARNLASEHLCALVNVATSPADKRAGEIGSAAALEAVKSRYRDKIQPQWQELAFANLPRNQKASVLEGRKRLSDWIVWSTGEPAVGAAAAPPPAVGVDGGAPGCGTRSASAACKGSGCHLHPPVHLVGARAAAALGRSLSTRGAGAGSGHGVAAGGDGDGGASVGSRGIGSSGGETSDGETSCRDGLRSDLCRVVLAVVLDGRPRRVVAPVAALLHSLVALAALVSQLRQASQPHPAATSRGDCTSDGPIMLCFKRLPAVRSAADGSHALPTGAGSSSPGTPRKTTNGESAGGPGKPAGGAGKARGPGKPAGGAGKAGATIAGDEEETAAAEEEDDQGLLSGPMEVMLVPCDVSVGEDIRRQRYYALEARMRARRAGTAAPADIPRDFVLEVPVAGFDGFTDEEPGDYPNGCAGGGVARSGWAAYRDRLRSCLSFYGGALLSCRDRGSLHHAALLIAQVQDDLQRASRRTAPAASPRQAVGATSSKEDPGLAVFPIPVAGCQDLSVREACSRILRDLPAQPAPNPDAASYASNLDAGWQAARRLGLNLEISGFLGLLNPETCTRSCGPTDHSTALDACGSAAAQKSLAEPSRASGENSKGGKWSGRCQVQPSGALMKEDVLLWVVRRPLHE